MRDSDRVTTAIIIITNAIKMECNKKIFAKVPPALLLLHLLLLPTVVSALLLLRRTIVVVCLQPCGCCQSVRASLRCRCSFNRWWDGGRVSETTGRGRVVVAASCGGVQP